MSSRKAQRAKAARRGKTGKAPTERTIVTDLAPEEIEKRNVQSKPS